ncbi:MAG: pyruvate formate-lyase-activating protein [Elusimicrobia bacterium]|nr:pyruvate formate-lyase-activating protein [Elusimicrobiota bacterium]
MRGKVHSIETLGTLDGPGLRVILFMQGCNMRCGYCHNPDTWDLLSGTLSESSEIAGKLLQYKQYFGKKGGVTFSGGEPLVQPDFLLEILKILKEKNVNIAIDTNGFYLNDAVKKCLLYTDLVILDIKHWNETKHKKLTGKSLNNTIAFLKYLCKNNIPVWIRNVVIPSANDSDSDIIKLARLIKQTVKDSKIVKKIELLGYHTMGIGKWGKLKMKYPLKNIPEMNIDKLKRLKSIFDKEYNEPLKK